MLPSHGFGPKECDQLLQQLGGLQHTAVARFATSLLARAHAQYNCTVNLRLGHIALSGRMRPHFPVHRWRKKQRHTPPRTSKAQQAKQLWR